nr:retrotransposon protein, putative, Ty1-copia subclass [Tanacetum cinerariifolium]
MAYALRPVVGDFDLRNFKDSVISSVFMVGLLVAYLIFASLDKRSFFEKQKLTGPNFINWYRQLRIVLSIEDKLHYLEQPIPLVPVAPEEIQRNLELLHAHEILKELKTLFAQQAEHELLQTTRDFHSCKQEEGQSHGVHAMLKLHEQTLTLPKSNAPTLHAIRAGHCKKNYPQYIAELMKKKKNVASGAGGSGIFVIELNTILNRSWIYETGCGTHICNTTQGLRASRKLKPRALSLYVGNGQSEAVEAIDAFYLCLPSGLEIVLNNCHYAPSITRGIISVSRLYEDGFINRFVDNTIQVSRNNVVYFSDVPKGWAFEKCVSCMSEKMARKPYTHQVERPKDLLGLIHTDLCGPFKIMSRQGASYFVTFTDDFNRYGYVYLLKHKHEVFETFKVFQNEVENQLGKTIKSLCSNRGGEYMSQEFLDHLKDHGIIAHRTHPYTPQHNGVSERRNRTLLDMVRSMMSQTTLLKFFWDYALETVARILNMVPTKKVEKTPYEVWHGKAPKLSYLKVWGCEALVKRDTLTKLEKLEPRSIKSTRTRHAPGRMCLYIDAEEQELGDLGEPANYKAALLDPDKWLFKKKTDMDGNVHIYKDRLVAKGYTQTPGIDYEETFFPVADIRAIRILIAIAAYYDYEIWQMDVKTAFLNGYLNDEVYMEQPEGFVNPKYPNRVCKLKRSIYGLKQASRPRNKRFDDEIKKFGFIQNRDEPCVYQKASGSNITFLILYVDDILIMGNSIPMLQSVKTYLGKCFAIKDLGEAAYILGIKIYRDRSKRLIGLCQSAYIEKILKQYCMENSKRGSIPMQKKLKLSKSQGASTPDEMKRMQNVPYASAVESIMYAVRCTRPDVAFA